MQRTNWVRWSEDLDHSDVWVPTNLTISPNVAQVSPTGTPTVEKLTETVTIGEHKIVAHALGIPLDRQVVFSKYFYAAEKNELWLQMVSGAPGAVATLHKFTLVGAGSVVAEGAQVGEDIRTVIAKLSGTDWYRCSVSAFIATANDVTVGVHIRYPAAAGDGVSGLYAWGAQVEEGVAPTEYTPTQHQPVTVDDGTVRQVSRTTHLFDNRVANGNGVPFYNQSFVGNNLARIEGTLYFTGAFAAGTVTIQVYDGKTWYAVAGISITAAGTADLDIDGVALRAVLTGAGVPSITVTLVGLNDLVRSSR